MKRNSQIKNIFTTAYEKNLWGDEFSVSGPGSSPDQTKIIKADIFDLLKEYKITSIIDAPCGDYSWMKEIIHRAELDCYSGFDIVEELIDRNNKEYQTDKITFNVKDLTREIVPKGDLIICRDCFLHLSYRNIYKILRNFKRSGSRYLLASSYIKHNNTNVIRFCLPGRAINLEKGPFNSRGVLEVINENYWGQNGEFSDKSLLLLELNSVYPGDIFVNVLLNEIIFIPQFYIIRFFGKLIRKIRKLSGKVTR